MRRILLSLLALTVASCGAAPPDVRAPAAPVAEAQAPLDWAMLLPIDTNAVIRVDLARIRRSPYGDLLEAFVTRALDELRDEALRPAFEALFDRTDVVLAALGPSGEHGDGSFILFARGAYRPDELERLWASSPESPLLIEADELRVWSTESSDLAGAMTLLREDTLLLTDSVPRIHGVIARTRMASGAPRWPHPVRELAEDLDIEDATIGVLVGDQLPEDDGPPLSLGGRADVDGPLDVDVRVSLQHEDVSATMLAATTGELLQAFTRRADGAPTALTELANIAEIEAHGSGVRVRIRADRETAGRLVPAFVRRVFQELDGEEMPVDPL